MADMFHKHGGDIYSYDNIRDFSANINAKGMPEAVRDAAVNGIAASVHYPDPQYKSLRAALAKRENELLLRRAQEENQLPARQGQKENHLPIRGALSEKLAGAGQRLLEPEHIICGNGAAELMFSLAAALKPNHALVAAPSFYEYEQALASVGCEIHRYYLREETEFAFDRDFAAQIPENTDMIILGNPNNPTGQIIPSGILREILEICREKQIFLVLDESFFDFLTEEDQGDTLGGAGEAAVYPGIFVLKSFTKMYAMPGLRFGYGICSDTGLLERMRQVMQPWNVSVPAQWGARAAAAELEFAADTAQETADNRRWLQRELEKAGYRVFPSRTNFLLFKGPEGLWQHCLDRGYLIRDCSNFPGLERAGGEKYFRICVRSMNENAALMKALRCE